MSDSAWVQPASFTIPLSDPVRRPVADWNRAAGLWAELAIEGVLLERLHVGAGIPELAEDRLVAGMVLVPAGGGAARPFVPGSSVKGALRAVFEAVTASCDPLEPQSQCAPPKRSDPDKTLRACPTCALFGLPGLRGAMTVSDLTITGDLALSDIPQRYEGKLRRGRRLYSPVPEATETDELETLQVVRPGARLAGSVTFAGAEPWLASVLLAVAGVVPDGLPHVRLGGGKAHGLGVTELQVAGDLRRGGGCLAAPRAPPGYA